MKSLSLPQNQLIDCGVYISEINDIKNKSFDPDNTGILNCSVENLKRSCLYFMAFVDDAQQLAYDKGMFDAVCILGSAYDDADHVYRHAVDGGLISDETRNHLRMIMKEAYGLVSYCQILH